MPQWTKNLLVFVPPVCAHRFTDLETWLQAAGVFAVLSLAASGQYAFNDVLDAPFDRAHPVKRNRPVASGELGRTAGFALGAGLAVASLLAAWLMPPGVFGLVALYHALSLGYSLFLKRLPVVDVVLLAGLYTLRLFAGGAAAGIAISRWLLLFSACVFVSLALLKRFQEARESDLGNRPYRLRHAGALAGVGAVAGALAVVVLAGYIRHSGIAALYRSPDRLWWLCLLCAFWMGRIWLLARGGGWTGCPLSFVLRDPASYATALCACAVIFFAL